MAHAVLLVEDDKSIATVITEALRPDRQLVDTFTVLAPDMKFGERGGPRHTATDRKAQIAQCAEGRFLAHWDEFVEHRKEARI